MPAQPSYYVRLPNRQPSGFCGPSHPTLNRAKEAAEGWLRSSRSDRVAEVGPFVPGPFGGAGVAVARVDKAANGRLTWTELERVGVG